MKSQESGGGHIHQWQNIFVFVYNICFFSFPFFFVGGSLLCGHDAYWLQMVSKETEPREARHVETVGYSCLAPTYLLFMQKEKKKQEEGGREGHEKREKRERIENHKRREQKGQTQSNRDH